MEFAGFDHNFSLAGKVASPSAQALLDAFKAANGGKGVACLSGNYAGDNLNVKMAKQLAALEGIEVKTVIANDDVASAPKSAPKEEREKRRGVAGEVLMWKVGGAKAALGGSLDAVTAAAQKAVDNCRSIGVGLTPCTIPAVGKPNFSIEAGKMEVGIGHHGQPGILVTDLKSADEIASCRSMPSFQISPSNPGMKWSYWYQGWAPRR
jgi:dihydroxyacetone kinase-like protein